MRLNGQELAHLPWQKALASTMGNCIELAPYRGGVAMRDSKDPDGPVLMFSKADIRDLLDAAKRSPTFDGQP